MPHKVYLWEQEEDMPVNGGNAEETFLFPGGTPPGPSRASRCGHVPWIHTYRLEGTSTTLDYYI